MKKEMRGPDKFVDWCFAIMLCAGFAFAMGVIIYVSIKALVLVG